MFTKEKKLSEMHKLNAKSHLEIEGVNKHLHVSLISHLACMFTKQTINFCSLKWASLMQNRALKSDV